MVAKRAEHNEGCPIHKLKKDELLYLATHHCRHGHTFLEHWSCYRPALDHVEHIGFLDIETSNLDADFGIILSYCILDSITGKILYKVIAKEDIEKLPPGEEDTNVVRQLIIDMKKFEKLVTYFGSRFDIPYIRTRAVVDDIPAPPFGTILHYDLYYTIRHRFKMSSNRLENACRTLLKKTQKTRVDGKFWRAGTRGDAKSLKYILDHNKKDVVDLQNLFDKVVKFAKVQNKSM